LRIRLEQVRSEPLDWAETCTIPAESLERPELQGLSPIAWRGRVQFNDPGFYLRARYSYEQSLACNRCLKPIVEPVSGEMDLLVMVASARPLAGEHELEEADLGVLSLPNDILETDSLLLEQVQLNIPMKPLCRPDCAGLCPTCGADRNLGPCGCPSSNPDPRWHGLQLLKERLNERN
jgi:uncharacterized protein